jgi:hypothetical protein
MSQPLSPQSPLWNVVSLALPLVTIAGSVAILLAGDRDSFADGIGGLIRVALGLTAVGALGEAAAVAALMRSERWAALSVLGIVANALILIPGLWLVARVIAANR